VLDAHLGIFGLPDFCQPPLVEQHGHVQAVAAGKREIAAKYGHFGRRCHAVVIGLHTIDGATLTITARLKRFDVTLEEVVYNLGATRAAVLWTITLPYLKPALIISEAISFLMSFENLNTTLMLVGSDSPLTVVEYGRMREGATPVLNAVSLLLMTASAVLALTLLRGPKAAERNGAAA